MNGVEWYETCSELIVATDVQRLNAAPERKQKYKECQLEAINVFCKEINFQGDGNGTLLKLNDKYNKLLQQNPYPESDFINHEDYSTVLQNDMINFHKKLLESWKNNCPLSGKPYQFVIKALDETGEPNILYKLLPAKYLIKKTLIDNYPNCEASRASLGMYPSPNYCFEVWYNKLD